VTLLLWREAVYYDARTNMSEAVRTILQTNAETARETAAEADAGFLWDFWYPAVRSTAITGRKLVTAMLLEVPLVLGRTSEGRAFAMRDSCPHRGIPLSYGRLDGRVVECCYHGWRFDACSGQCLEIPSLSSQEKLKVERIFAGHYPCQERDGYVWVYMNSPGTRLPETIPGAPGLTVFSNKYKITHLSCELPSHIDHGIIGLMDPAHGPFVHQSWFWRKRGSIHSKENHQGTGDDDDRFRAAECPHGGGSQREAVVFQPGDGDAGAAGFVPDRFRGGMESFLSAGFDFPDLRQDVSAPGSADDDPAGGRIETQSAVDADR
jgi:phenylpropionate dioxygenase-like ring-hydroxylating dioxygenase large terminal subunit